MNCLPVHRMILAILSMLFFKIFVLRNKLLKKKNSPSLSAAGSARYLHQLQIFRLANSSLKEQDIITLTILPVWIIKLPWKIVEINWSKDKLKRIDCSHFFLLSFLDSKKRDCLFNSWNSTLLRKYLSDFVIRWPQSTFTFEMKSSDKDLQKKTRFFDRSITRRS